MPKKVTVRPEIRTVDKETGEVIVTPAITKEVADPIDNFIRRGFKLLFKTPFNHDTKATAAQSATINYDPSKVQAHQMEDTDINVIMRKYHATGVAPGARVPPEFVDLPEIDMQQAIDLVRAGQEAFDSQPAEIRAFFRNNMANYTATVERARKTGDRQTLERLGLYRPDPNAAPAPPPAAKDEKKPPVKTDPPSKGDNTD